MLFYIIAMGIVGAILIYMLKRTGKNDAVGAGFSLKCKDCGYHKGILKCVNCEDRKKDKWR